MAKRIIFALILLSIATSLYASEFTTNYNLEIPAIGARDWQPIISKDIISIDTVVGIISADTATTRATDAAQDVKLTILTNDAVQWTTDTTRITILSNDAVAQNNYITIISNDAALIKAPTYITQTTNSHLTNEQALSSLADGIMRVANGTGTVTSLTDVLPVANGGTGSAIGYTVVSNDIADLKLAGTYKYANIATASTDISTTGAVADMTNMTITFTATGNPVLVLFSAPIRADSVVAQIMIDIDGATKGSVSVEQAAAYPNATSLCWLQTLSAASHTIKIRWVATSGTVYQDGLTYGCRTLVVIEL